MMIMVPCLSDGYTMIYDNLSVMQTPKTALVGGANDEHTPCVPTSGSRPRNIGSVRAASLHASGLRAAARTASNGSVGKDVIYESNATVNGVVNMSEKPYHGLHGMGTQCNARALDAGQVTGHSPCMLDSAARSRSTAFALAASLDLSGIRAANLSMEKDTVVQFDSHATMEVTHEIVEGLPASKNLKSVCGNNQHHAGISPLNQAKERGHVVDADENCRSAGRFKQPVGQKVRKLFINFEETSSASGPGTTRPATDDKEVQGCDMSSLALQQAEGGTNDVHKENINATAASGGEKTQCFNQKSTPPSTIYMPSSANLSYTESQEPGEDSQLNAFVTVDKLVWLNASAMWQEPESKMVAEQSSVKSSQGVKGLQSLAYTAEIKNMQDKIGIYDWIDSQPDEDGLSSDLKEVFAPVRAQQQQLEACKPTKNRKRRQQAMKSSLDNANDSNSASVMAKGTSCIKQAMASNVRRTTYECAMKPHPLTAQLRTDKGKPTEELNKCFEHEPYSPVRNNVTDELHDADASSHKGETEIIIPSDISSNTQIALEAIDIMKCGVVMNDENSHQDEREILDIGISTQSAIEAMDILRHGVVTDAVFIEREENQTDLRIQQPSTDAKKCVTPQGSALNRGWKDLSGKAGGDLLAKSTPPPALITISRKGGLSLGVPENRKPISKRDTSGGFSASLETHRSQKARKFLPKPRRLVVNSRMRSPLDFLSAVVPRRKRSHLCAPIGSLNGNMVLLQRQDSELDLHKSHQNSHEQIKVSSLEFRKSVQPQKNDDNNTKLAVLVMPTKGKLLRQTKKLATLEAPRKSDCCALLEERTKRRKREPGCIRVLFSHSLLEDTIKHQKKILAKLGGHLATSAADSTHFVANSFVRTQNMLESMAAGKAVITTLWLEGCSQAHYFVDETSYILQDVKKEKELGFCMHSSLAASRRKPLLKGMKLFVSPNTMPDFEAMRAIIKSAGGQAVQKVLRSSQLDGAENESISIVIASEEDLEFCVSFIESGLRVYSTELILHGIVSQNLDFSRNRLFEEYPH